MVFVPTAGPSLPSTTAAATPFAETPEVAIDLSTKES